MKKIESDSFFMCGRYVFVSEPQELKTEFPDLSILSSFSPRTNISPGMVIDVVQFKDNYQVVPMQWGLVPSWAKDHSATFKTFNARSETITEKPSFKTPFKRKRCVIPANGFYEWKTEGKKKTPHFFFPSQEKMFYFAGLFDEWESPNGYLESCTLITTSANEILSEVHDRMPVILDPKDFPVWFSKDSQEKDLLPLLKPAPKEWIQKKIVSAVKEGFHPLEESSF
jgi:putative SOS response-associated peptidase YedK